MIYELRALTLRGASDLIALTVAIHALGAIFWHESVKDYIRH